MGRTKRRYYADIIAFKKLFKQPVSNVLSIMPVGFSCKMFSSEFACCYEYLWQDIQSKYFQYRDMNYRRAKKRLDKIYSFPRPEVFLHRVAYHKLLKVRKEHKSGKVLSPEERKALRMKMIAESKNKVHRRNQKKQYNLRYIQNVKPKYTNFFIEEYFRCKRCNPKDVVLRSIIIQEAARYKCPETIAFLHKVNSSERNFHLRHFAFLALQRFGETVILRKNRKGKKRPGDTEPFEIAETPKDLLNLIYNSQMEQNKKYDIFLSHSYKDYDRLLELKTMLNQSGFNVYLDWVCDREALKRELTNEDTARVIIERLENSSALLYVYTESCAQSQWAPWELGYFSASGKAVYVLLEMNNKTETPPYLDLYKRVKIKDGVVVTEQDDTPLQNVLP